MDTMLLWLVISGQTFDTATTLMKMKQGCREGAPLYRALHITTGPRIIAFKGGVMVGMTIPLSRAKPSKTKTAAALILAGGGFAAGAYNLTIRCR